MMRVDAIYSRNEQIKRQISLIKHEEGCDPE